MTNNEQAAAHRILQKHSIYHKLEGHQLPATSKDFAIEIGVFRFTDFEEIRSYIEFTGQNLVDAASEFAEAARRDANARKP
jgi:hypothetical protein